MDGLAVHHAAYGVYHPDYDAHVYRNIYLHRVDAEPINRGHDDESIQYGTFTYENLTIESSRIGRDPLIQMACTSPLSGQAGHFRNVTIKNSDSRQAKVVDWEITLDAGLNSPVVAQTTDKAGNQEKVNHEFRLK